MKKQPITRLETQLERLIEGGFTRLFGNKLSAQDIALKLARAMEDNTAPGEDNLPYAPDEYTIHAAPEVERQLNRHNLPQALGGYMMELANQSGYHLLSRPIVKILTDHELEGRQIVIAATHSHLKHSSTAAMQRVEIQQQQKPANPQLLIDKRPVIPLDDEIINIGRSRSNHIILNDNTVSRHHLQIRLRGGHYALFDVHSSSGTFVNGIQVKEHQLKSGDVIRIGKTQIIYFEDDGSDETDEDSTGVFDPLF